MVKALSLVSKKKRRYKADGYNLDLSYLTNKVITMGFPSSPTGWTRFDDSSKTSRRIKVNNLCPERFFAERQVQLRVLLTFEI